MELLILFIYNLYLLLFLFTYRKFDIVRSFFKEINKSQKKLKEIKFFINNSKSLTYLENAKLSIC